MRTDHSKIQLAYFRNGVDSVRQMIANGHVTGFMLRRALKEMEAGGGKVSDVKAFRDLLDEHGFMPSSKAGNKPEAGDVRIYKVQQGKSGLFIRFPVDHMDVAKGEGVRVRFTVGGGSAESAEERQ